ncbi:hypothetical protein VPH35_094722 [Triticum aestivum]
MYIANVSHISLIDIKKFKSLTKVTVGRCDGLFPEELDGSIVFHSVKSLKLHVSHLTRSKSSLSKVLNCFTALSMLAIDGGNEECVIQLPSSSSLQKLSFWDCKRLGLVPVEENGGGMQEDKSLLQSLTIKGCGKLFSQTSMKSMALLSNLTSLTTLKLSCCSNLTVDGFSPLIAVSLIQLEVHRCNTPRLAADMLSEVAFQRAKLLPAGYISRLEKLSVGDISGLLISPICNLLAPALHTLVFMFDWRMESLTEEQEKALQLLSVLQNLRFYSCIHLQSLPQGLHRLSSLKELCVISCPNIRSMPKEGLPVSLRKLQMNDCSAEIDEQIEKIKRTNPDLSVEDD